MDDSNSRRIVLFGKTGSGKSSLANTLFGENLFQVDGSANSGTTRCTSETRTINERSIQLVDTPGFFDTDPRSTELNGEFVKCLVECAPGPHAFILVLKIEKYTKLEQASVNLMLRYFSPEVLKYTTVVFTHGDDLPEGQTIDYWVRQNEALNTLVQSCGGRCHVIDNKYWNNSIQDSDRNNQFQIKNLLNSIDQTVRANEGRFYTNELLEKVHEELQRHGGSKQKAQEFITKNWKLMTIGIGTLLGGFMGGYAARKIAALCGASTLGTRAAERFGRLLGGCVGKVLVGGDQTPLDGEVELFVSGIYELWDQMQNNGSD